jgi:phosphatidate cytidylyltransferase
MLRYRLLTAAVAIPLELAVIYLGGWPLVAFVFLVVVLGLGEFYQLAAAPRRHGSGAVHGVPSWIRWSGYLVAVLAPVVALARSGTPITGLLVACALLVALSAAGSRRAASTARSALPAAISIGFVGSLLLPGLLSHLVYLRHMESHGSLALAGLAVPRGAGWLALVVGVCWVTDSAALCIGKVAGRHKLWPSVSPGKTIEGSLGGLFASVLATLWFSSWLGLSTGHAVALGCALGVVGQLGDLAESKLKRWAGVKDSGSILPGHGGILDHVDSLLAAGPFAYYYLRLVVGVH